MNGIHIWGLLKVRYETAAKLEPLCNLFRGNIWSLNMMVNGQLIGFVDWFLVLAIMQQEIDSNADYEDKLVIKMAKHIEYPLFSGPCKNMKDCDTSATLRSNAIIRTTGQIKRGMEYFS